LDIKPVVVIEDLVEVLPLTGYSSYSKYISVVPAALVLMWCDLAGVKNWLRCTSTTENAAIYCSQ